MTAEEKIQYAEEVLTGFLRLHTKMEEKLVVAEGLFRQNNFRIYGVPDGAEKDLPTMALFLEKILRVNLRHITPN